MCVYSTFNIIHRVEKQRIVEQYPTTNTLTSQSHLSFRISLPGPETNTTSNYGCFE